MNDWHIQSRAHACQACGKAFAEQQVYHTLLFEDLAGFVRQDVCQACWTSQFSQGAAERKGFVSHWHGDYEAPPAAPPDPIKRETAETLLRKLIERADPQFAPAIFILAAMLERKRLLKVKEQVTREGRRVTIYEHPGTGDLMTVPDPDLHLNQLDQVQHDVAALLEHGLPEDRAPVAETLPLPLEDGSPAPPAIATGETPSPPATESPATEAPSAEAPVGESGPTAPTAPSVAEPPHQAEGQAGQGVLPHG